MGHKNMKWVGLAAAPLVFLATSAPVLAQAQARLPEPMVQAARKAVTTNPEVQERFNAFKAAGHQRDVARGGFLPQIDLTLSAGAERSYEPGRAPDNYNFDAGRLSLNQMLFDGFFTASEVKRLGYARLTRYYELVERSELAAQEAVRAYLDVLRYRELVEAATENYVEHKRATQLVEERANSGVGRRVDVEQATGRLALAEANLATELQNLHDVSARYLRVVGEKPAANLPGLPETFGLPGIPASSDALIKQGLQNSPTMLAAVENARALRQGVRTTKAAYMPRVDLRASEAWGSNTGGTLGDSRTTTIQLVLNYNLYRGGADLARERQAGHQADQARDLQEKACRDVRQSLAIAYSDARSLAEQLKYQDAHRLSTEKTREGYRQQFDIGQRTLLDLLDTQNEFFQASRAYITTRHNQAAAQARVLGAMGELVKTLAVTREDIPTPAQAGQDREGIDAQDLCTQETVSVDTVDQIKSRVNVPPPPRVVEAGPSNYVTLLPDADGTVGKVVVQGARGQMLIQGARESAPLDGGSAAFTVSEEQIKKDFGPALAAQSPRPEITLMYFKLGGSQLLPESKAELPKVIARIRQLQQERGPNAVDALVIGHTDTLGNPAANIRLGLSRARVVEAELRRLGLNDVRVVIDSHGEANQFVKTGDNVNEAKNRRAEINLR